MNEHEEHSHDCPDHGECNRETENLYKAREVSMDFIRRASRDFWAYAEIKLGIKGAMAMSIWYATVMSYSQAMQDGLAALRLAGGNPTKLREILNITEEEIEASHQKQDEVMRLWKMGEGVEPDGKD